MAKAEMASFLIQNGADEGRTLSFDRDVTIGRGPAPDLSLQHPTVSRRHARVRVLEGGRYLITDLESDNGTRVNGNRISQPTSLSDGDRVNLGVVELLFRAAPAAREASALRMHEEVAPQMVLHAVAAPDWGSGAQGLDTDDRLRVLYEVGEALSESLDEQKLLGKMLERVFAAFPQADRGFVLVRSEDGEGLDLRAARTRSGAVAEVGVSRTLVSDAMDNRRAILVADAAGEFGSAQDSIFDLKLRSVVCVPIVAQDRVWGVLQLDASSAARQFQKEDAPLLLAIASQAGLALAGARMHSRLLKQELLQQDLQLAARIQLQFLPKRPPRFPGWEFADKYNAALEVGGDYYDFLDLRDNRVGIAVGDVCGKGVPAALYMARLSSEVRYQSAGDHDPVEILRRVNRTLSVDLADDMFVTLLLATLEPASGELRLASAGHLPPLVRRAEGRVERLNVTGAPPAGFDPDVQFRQVETRLEPGDVAVLYTDGVTEAMNAANEEFGEPRLEAALVSAEPTADGVLRSVLAAVDAFVGDAPQSDDRALVCFGRPA